MMASVVGDGSMALNEGPGGDPHVTASIKPTAVPFSDFSHGMVIMSNATPTPALIR